MTYITSHGFPTIQHVCFWIVTICLSRIPTVHYSSFSGVFRNWKRSGIHYRCTFKKSVQNLGHFHSKINISTIYFTSKGRGGGQAQVPKYALSSFILKPTRRENDQILADSGRNRMIKWPSQSEDGPTYHGVNISVRQRPLLKARVQRLRDGMRERLITVLLVCCS